MHPSTTTQQYPGSGAAAPAAVHAGTPAAWQRQRRTQSFVAANFLLQRS